MTGLRQRTLLPCLALAIASAFPALASAQYIAPDPGGQEFAAVPVPAPGKVFGLNEDIIDFSHSQGPAAYADYASIAGANVVKTTLEWWRAQDCLDENGVRVYENCETIQWSNRRWGVWAQAYNALRARGITPLFVLASAPIWYRENTTPSPSNCPSCRYPPGPANDAKWAEFVTRVATAFPESIIQVWNEPNLHYWWGKAPPDPERYAELVQVAYDAVQAVEDELGPAVEIPVVAPALANVPDTPEAEADPDVMSMRDFLDAAYAAPAPLADHIDALAINMFPHDDDYGKNTLLASSFQDVRQAQAAAGDVHKILITETGLPATDVVALGTVPWDEAERAFELWTLYNRLMTMDDVIGVIFHRIIEPLDSNPENPLEHGYAWMKYAPPPDPLKPQVQAAAPEPKLVYCVFAELAEGLYPQCLEATITDGPKGRIKQRRVRFYFEAGPSSTVGTRFQCSLDRPGFRGCESGQQYRVKPGKHVFKVRARNATDFGTPATRKFRVAKRN